MSNMEKLCGSVLRTLNYGRNLKHVQRNWVFYRSRSSTVNAADVLDSQSSLEAEYEKAKPFNEIPGPKGMPFIGTLLQYRKGPFQVQSFHDALLHRYREFGPIFKETIAGETVVHLLDPEFIKVVYQHESKIPHIPPLLETTQMYREFRGLSPGLGNTNGEEWYRLRSAVQQMMMRPKAVSMYLPEVNEVADDFMSNMEKRRNKTTNQIDGFMNEILKWSLESSGMTCFETRLGCLEADRDSHQQKMIEANGAIFSLSLKLKFTIPLYKYISTPTWKKLVEAEDYFFGNGQKLVDETVKKIEDLTDQGKLEDGQYGFLTYLLSKKELSYKDLSIITLSLFGDGLSTTAPTLVGQLYCLAANPEKQEKLRNEIISVISPDEEITVEHLNKISYMKACIKEGFRFFPIGTEVSRIPQKNLVIGGYRIPSGTTLELNNNMLLRQPEYFKDPEKYIPERWVRGGSEYTQSTHPYLLIPFGHGPRMCAGRRFAEQEMYVVIAKILQKFKLSWTHSKPMRQKYHLLLKPDKTSHFTFTKL